MTDDRPEYVIDFTPKGVAWVHEEARLADMTVNELFDSWIKEFGFDKLDPDMLK